MVDKHPVVAAGQLAGAGLARPGTVVVGGGSGTLGLEFLERVTGLFAVAVTAGWCVGHR